MRARVARMQGTGDSRLHMTLAAGALMKPPNTMLTVGSSGDAR